MKTLTKIIDTSTLKGLKQAEKIHLSGNWSAPILIGIDKVKFEKLKK
jgi:hypothetical protein